MNDKKKNVELTDLAAEGAEDVKGGAASPTQTFASININTGISAGISQTIPTATRIGNTIDPGKFANQSTVMCPW